MRHVSTRAEVEDAVVVVVPRRADDEETRARRWSGTATRRRARARDARANDGGEGGEGGRERRGDDDDDDERGRGRRGEDVSVDAFERVVVVVARDDVVEGGKERGRGVRDDREGRVRGVRGGGVRGGGGDVRRRDDVRWDDGGAEWRVWDDVVGAVAGGARGDDV